MLTMRSIPPHETIHRTLVLRRPENGAGQSFSEMLAIGCDQDRSLWTVWVESESPSGRGIRPLGFTENSAKATEKFNDYLDAMGEKGYDISGELRVSPDFLAKFTV